MKISKRQLRRIIKEELEEGMMDNIKGFFTKNKPEKKPESESAPTPKPAPKPAPKPTTPEPPSRERVKYIDAVRKVSAARDGLHRSSARKFVERSNVRFPAFKQSLNYIKEFEKKYGPLDLYDGESQAHFPVSDFYEFEKEYEITQQQHKDRERRARASGEIS